MTAVPGGFDRSDIAWAAWRRAEDGRLEVVLTLRIGDELRRERHDYPDLEAAAAELGASFREVVEKVREAGREEGRWRP